MDQFNELKDKVENKKLNNFWLICGRSDFKPFLDTTKKDIIKFISDKLQYYKNKNIANVSIIFRPKINFDKINDDDWVFSIQITIYNINNNGEIDYNVGSTWMLSIETSKKEFLENKFVLKELPQMIEMASDRRITSDVGGISYTSWLNKLAKKSKNVKRKTRKL
jgi:hypothetical protein